MSHVAKKHHYVPQFILREFSHSGSQVQVFDKSNDNQFPSSVMNAGHQNGFYSWDEEVAGEKIKISLESVLAGIDGAGSNVIQKVIRDQSLAKLSEKERKKRSISFHNSSNDTRECKLRMF